VSARFVNSSRCWQCLAVLVGLVVLMWSVTPLVAAAGQEDGESVPVIAIARTRVSSSVSRTNGTDRIGTASTHTAILVAESLEVARNSASPRVVGSRSVLDISSSFRC
jgi:hypothetical protein